MHSRAIRWAAVCSGGAWDRGADIVQEAYVRVLRGSATFRAESGFTTWWLGVVRLTAFEEARRVRRRANLLRHYSEGRTSEYGCASEPEASRYDGKQAVVEAALTELSPRQRQVLHLTFYQQLSLREAAAVMGVSLGSARRYYARAKCRLRKLLRVETTGDD
ncbi:MAG: RNA polymerase sigma factor [Planctomycetaceae bacterium]